MGDVILSTLASPIPTMPLLKAGGLSDVPPQPPSPHVGHMTLRLEHSDADWAYEQCNVAGSSLLTRLLEIITIPCHWKRYSQVIELSQSNLASESEKNYLHKC